MNLPFLCIPCIVIVQQFSGECERFYSSLFLWSRTRVRHCRRKCKFQTCMRCGNLLLLSISPFFSFETKFQLLGMWNSSWQIFFVYVWLDPEYKASAISVFNSTMFFGLIHLIRLSGLKSNAWLTKCWSLRRQVSWMLSGLDLLNNNTTNWVYSDFVSYLTGNSTSKVLWESPRIDVLNLQRSKPVSRCFSNLNLCWTESTKSPSPRADNIFKLQRSKPDLSLDELAL